MEPITMLAGLTASAALPLLPKIISRNNIESKLDLIFQRANICVETKENDKPRKLYPELIRTSWNGKNRVFYYKMPLGMDYFKDVLPKTSSAIFSSLKNEALVRFLEVDKKAGSRKDEAHFSITILNKRLEDEIKYTNEHEQLNKKKNQLWIMIGHSRRTLEQINLAKESTPYILIAGVPGSGKSCLLRLILTTIHLNYSSREVELWLLDMKEGIEFSLFENSILTVAKASSPEEAKPLLSKLLFETRKTYTRIKQAGYEDINEYNDCEKDYIPRKILAIDEYALMDKEAKKVFGKIVQIGRAAGTHVIVSTQRPDRKVIDGTVKNNIPVIVALKCNNPQSSRVVLGEGDDRAAYIEHSGRAILQTMESVQLQVPYLSFKQAKLLMSPFSQPKQYKVEVEKEI